MAEARTLPEIIGALVRRRREELALRQDDVVRELRRYGLTTWRRSTLASLELGRRRLDLEEVWHVCVALETSLADLVSQGDRYELVAYSDQTIEFLHVRQAIAGGPVLDEDEVQKLRHAFETGLQKLKATAAASAYPLPDETVVRAARTLGVRPAAVVDAGQRLWGRQLPDERDARVVADERSGDSARTVQARRGWVTRQLLEELRSELAAAARDTADADRSVQESGAKRRKPR